MPLLCASITAYTCEKYLITLFFKESNTDQIFTKIKTPNSASRREQEDTKMRRELKLSIAIERWSAILAHQRFMKIKNTGNDEHLCKHIIG